MRLSIQKTHWALVSVCLLAGCTFGSGQEDATGIGTQRASQASDKPDYVVRTTNSGHSELLPESPRIAASHIAAKRQADLLPEERKLITGNAVSIDAVGQMIRTPAFDRFVTQLSAESASDPLAMDVTAFQRKYLEAKLGDLGTLGDFACGLSVCAGTVRGGKEIAGFDRFRQDFLDDPSAAAYSLLDYPMVLENGDVVVRLVMSADPTVDGVSTIARPPVPARQ